MKGAGDTDDGMLTIPVSETIATSGDGDIVVKRGRYQSQKP